MKHCLSRELERQTFPYIHTHDDEEGAPLPAESREALQHAVRALSQHVQWWVSREMDASRQSGS